LTNHSTYLRHESLLYGKKIINAFHNRALEGINECTTNGFSKNFTHIYLKVLAKLPNAKMRILYVY